MAINPLGYVPALDFGTPRIFTARAREAISGGQLVSISGASAAVTSGLASFVSADIEVSAAGSGLNVGGIAIKNTESGAYVGVLTRGVVILTAGGTVTGGFKQEAIGEGVQDGTSGIKLIGRALTTTTSGAFALIDLNI